MVREGRVGAGINFNNAQDVAAAQRLARQSRLGIPLIFGLDVLHGFRTIFPMPLAETATFNPALARMAAESSAREAAYVGVQWTYAPMADIARDPRWGRIIEGAGEDPYLGRRVHDGARRGAARRRARDRGQAFRRLRRRRGRARLRRDRHPAGRVPRCLPAAVPGRGRGRNRHRHERLQRAERRAGDGEPVAPHRHPAQRVGLYRLRGVGLGGDPRAHRPRHRGRRRRGRPQGIPRRRRHGPCRRPLRPSPRRRGAGRARAGGRGRRGGPARAARQVPPRSVRADGHRREPRRCRVPDAAIASGGAGGRARIPRAAAEPRRHPAACARHAVRRGRRRARRQRQGSPWAARGARASRGHGDDSRRRQAARRESRGRRRLCRWLQPALRDHRGLRGRGRGSGRGRRRDRGARRARSPVGRGGVARPSRPEQIPARASRRTRRDGKARGRRADGRAPARDRAGARPARRRC